MKLILLIWLLVVIASIGIISCLPKKVVPRLEYTMKVPGLVTKKTIGIWIDKRLWGRHSEIEMAIGTWNYCLNGNIKLVVESWDFDMKTSSVVMSVKMGGWLVIGIEEGSALIPEVGKNGYRVLGFADMVGGSHLYYVMPAGEDKRKVYGTMLHEIGHLLGAGHNGERLMNPYYSPWKYGCVDKGTIEAVAKYRGLEIEGLNWCL